MPLATELLPLLLERLQLDEMREWLNGLCQRIAWLSGEDQHASSFPLNIEQVFQYAYFDIEVFRLWQHLAPVGRQDGETPWRRGESIEAWLSYLEDALRDVVSAHEERCDLAPITRWAQSLNTGDAVLSFNYDTLVERALKAIGTAWNHGFDREGKGGIPVYKLHGSIDWIVAHRTENLRKIDLLFDKANANRSNQDTDSVEDDCRLWRCRTAQQRQNWIETRDLQMIPKDASPRTVGIAGLGAFKELHKIPGLGRVWTRGMRALYEADRAIVVGFAMADFDAYGPDAVRARGAGALKQGELVSGCGDRPLPRQARRKQVPPRVQDG